MTEKDNTDLDKLSLNDLSPPLTPDEDPGEDGEIGEGELEQTHSTGTHQTSRFRRQQNSVFDSWCRDKAKTTDLSTAKTSYQKDEGSKVTSISELFRKQEGRRIIGSEYAFQLELFERAKQHNTIVVVDTGAGKTLVAMLLLKHVVNLDIEARASGTPRRVAFFLVDKVTLMLQQYFALCANLSFEIASICGAHTADIWTRDKWTDVLEKTDVIVCTADILLHALTRGFVKISQINLLIFDEAHHAKKDHPYAKIMRDFYPRESQDQILPRVFGMTASPIDVINSYDIADCVEDLESTLHSSIATRSDEDMESQRAKPIEEIINYCKSPLRTETVFQSSMRNQFKNLPGFKQLLERAAEINMSLGPWCADVYWTLAFSDRELNKFTAIADKASTIEFSDNGKARSAFEKEVKDLHAAHAKIQAYEQKELTPVLDNLSPKVLALRDCLLRHFERPTDSRCLVFVTRRETAKLLQAVFDRIGGPYIKCGCLVGSSTKDFEGQRYTFRQQILTLQSFRKGGLNCLFATSVAEEGLDVPDCNLVIRFDSCMTMIQYVQSRGRARHKNSRFIHLLERDNWEEQDRLEEIHQCEVTMRTYCQDLPKHQRLASDDDTDDENEDRERFPTFLIKSTGAKLTYHFSLSVLNHYISMLPIDEFDDNTVRFVTFVRDGRFVCEVSLPERAKISPVVGRPHSRKAHAKMSAAFEVCKLLRKQKLLNDHLLPTYVDQLHQMRGARLAIKSKKQQVHEMRAKPSIWTENGGCMPDRVFLTILRLEDGWDRRVRPLGLLTRKPLPELPKFPLFRLNGADSTLSCTMLSLPILLDERVTRQLTSFTMTVFKDIFNKTFDPNPESMPYWLAPLLETCAYAQKPMDPSPFLDWALLNDIDGQSPQKWESGMPNEALLGRFWIDPWDGGRRFFSQSIAVDLKPFDEIPKDVAAAPRKAANIIEYSSGLFQGSKSRRSWNEDQPVIFAQKIVHRLNILDYPNEKEQQTTMRCFICPEPLDISLLPPDVAAMCLVFPAVIHRLESYLIALEFCKLLDLDVTPERALEAITKDSDNSEEAEEEKINFQRGMGPNYERLEFIGDTFLKMATSICIFIRDANKDEHWMHVDRMTLLCNANLFNNAQDRGYPKYIRSKAFSRRTWYPPGLTLLKGKGANKKDEDNKLEQHLSNKSVADVCEAMIGAALVSHVVTGYEGPASFDSAVRAVSAFVSSKEHRQHDMTEWCHYAQLYQKETPEYQKKASSASEIEVAKKVERVHAYRFKHVKLLTSAFTHPSCGRIYANAPNYQRLEFLGDALLDMTAVKHLFYNYPRKDPQWMTEHKMAMVSNKFMGALGAKLGFNKFLNHNSLAIRAQITAFVEEFETAQQESRACRNFWETLKDPPKCMADMVEAYVGAMFIDSGFDFAVVQRFFDEHVKWFFEDMKIYDAYANNHPFNRLQEFLETSMGCKKWRVMTREILSDDEYSSTVMAGVMIHTYMVENGAGLARSSRVAKMEAAKKVYEELHGLAPFEFRSRFGCSCSLDGAVVDPISEEEGVENTAI